MGTWVCRMENVKLGRETVWEKGYERETVSRCMEFSCESLSSADQRGLVREPAKSFRIRCSRQEKNKTKTFTSFRCQRVLCHGFDLDLKENPCVIVTSISIQSATPLVVLLVVILMHWVGKTGIGVLQAVLLFELS